MLWYDIIEYNMMESNLTQYTVLHKTTIYNDIDIHIHTTCDQGKTKSCAKYLQGYVVHSFIAGEIIQTY